MAPQRGEEGTEALHAVVCTPGWRAKTESCSAPGRESGSAQQLKPHTQPSLLKKENNCYIHLRREIITSFMTRSQFLS